MANLLYALALLSFDCPGPDEELLGLHRCALGRFFALDFSQAAAPQQIGQLALYGELLQLLPEAVRRDLLPVRRSFPQLHDQRAPPPAQWTHSFQQKLSAALLAQCPAAKTWTLQLQYFGLASRLFPADLALLDPQGRPRCLFKAARAFHFHLPADHDRPAEITRGQFEFRPVPPGSQLRRLYLLRDHLHRVAYPEAVQRSLSPGPLLDSEAEVALIAQELAEIVRAADPRQEEAE